MLIVAIHKIEIDRVDTKEKYLQLTSKTVYYYRIEWWNLMGGNDLVKLIQYIHGPTIHVNVQLNFLMIFSNRSIEKKTLDDVTVSLLMAVWK